MPLSEPEKNRGNILSCRFSDMAEHVPIKKRRFLFRSPSPPPKIPIPDNIEEASPMKTQNDPVQSAAICAASSKSELVKMPVEEKDVRSKCPKKVREKSESHEDFSGISILAAAACSSSLGREFGYAEDGSGVEQPSVYEGPAEVSTISEALSKGLVREDFVNTSGVSIGTSSCVTTALAGELAATSTAECASEKTEDVEKRIKEPSSGGGALTVSSDISSMKDGDVVGSQKLHSRDDRLHWDLNVVMDAWEQPFGYQDAHSSDCISQSSGDSIRCNAKRKSAEACVLLSEPENSQSEDKKKLLQCEPRTSFDQISRGITKNQVMDDCSHKNQPLSTCHMSISSKCKNVPSSLVDNSDTVQFFPSSYMDEKSSSLNVKRHADNEPIGQRMNTDMVALALSDLKNVSGPCVPNMNCTVVSAGAATENTNVSAVDTQVRLTILHALDIEKKDIPKLTLSDKAFDDETDVKDDNDAQIYIASQVNNDVSSEKVKKEIDDPQAVTSDIKTKVDDFSIDGSEPAEADAIKEFEHLEKKFISDTPSDPCSTHGTEATGELHDDYDSQYEDGELREPTGHVWEECDAVHEEAEPINHVFDNSRYSVSAADHHVSESGHVWRPKDRDARKADNLSPVNGVGDGDERCAEPDRPTTDDKGHEKDENFLRVPASDDLLESNKILSAPVRVGDDYGREGRIYHLGTRSTDSETNTRAGSRPYRRGLLSRIERPVSHDMSFIEDRAENRSKFDGISARWERGTSYIKTSERFRYSMQSQTRNRPINSWNGSSDVRRFKRNYSPSYHYQVKPDGGATAKEDQGRVSAVSYSSHPSTNDESIADGDATRNFQSVHKLDGDLGSDRLMSRGRFLRYGHQMDRRTGRGRYHGPSPDDTSQSSFKYRRPFSRRDGGVSPNERRGYPFAHQHHARSSSRSRTRSPDPRLSRTRSPDPRLSPRGRSGAGNCGGLYLRHRSRSPNLRSEARLLRMTSPPHNQPGFGADHMTAFRPFQREHASPRSPRWITGRKHELGQFNYKQRPTLDRSPGRAHLRGYRADLSDSAQNPKQDGYYRPNTGRFSQMDDTGRALRLGESYENRRQLGPVHPARRGCEDGIAKRLHHDDYGDDFASTNRDLAEFHGRGIRSIGNRNEDMPRKFRGDGNFMYERNEKFSSNSKQFGFDGMDSSRNMRSGETYRSINPGRFNEMDGAGRGRRFVDSYDDRRRHYGAVHLPRRSDVEGMERRFNHDVDDNDPVAQSSCDDDATDCRGRNALGIDGCAGDLPQRQREVQELDLSLQEKNVSETSKPTDVQVLAENDAVKGSIPS